MTPKINFKQFRQLLLPQMLRGKQNTDLVLKVFDFDLRRLYDEFIAKTQQDEFLANHTSQVGSLKDLLRTQFNDINIDIFDGQFFQEIYLYNYNESNLEEVYSYNYNESMPTNNYLYTKSEYENTDNQCDYFVSIPDYLIPQIDNIKYYVNRYNPVGKIYNIYI